MAPDVFPWLPGEMVVGLPGVEKSKGGGVDSAARSLSSTGVGDCPPEQNERAAAQGLVSAGCGGSGRPMGAPE
jgi:hypothetical protein